MALCSFRCCSAMSLLLWWNDWMYICSYGSKRVGVLICLRRVIVSSMLPYSCLQLSMCSAYAERGSLFLVHRMCSRNFDFKFRLVCPTYALSQVLRVILYITLYSCICNRVGAMGFMRWWNVVVILNAMPIFVFFNKLVIFLIFSLWKVNVVQIFLSFLLVFLLLNLCSICRLSFSSRCCGKL